MILPIVRINIYLLTTHNFSHFTIASRSAHVWHDVVVVVVFFTLIIYAAHIFRSNIHIHIFPMPDHTFVDHTTPTHAAHLQMTFPFPILNFPGREPGETLGYFFMIFNSFITVTLGAASARTKVEIKDRLTRVHIMFISLI